MTMLVSLAEQKQYSRVVTTASDAEIELLIMAASAAVYDHLASGLLVYDYLDSDGNAIAEDSDGVALGVPAVVKAATLFLTETMLKFKGGDPEKLFADGHLPYPVRALLGPLRDPVMS